MNLIYKPWQYACLLLVIVLSLIYAIPNLYQQYPSIEFKPKPGFELESQLIDKVKRTLKNNNLKIMSINQKDQTVSIIFHSVDDQINAKDILSPLLYKNYLTSLNLISSVPDWLTYFGATPMKLGLDLQGGVHFLLELDTRDIKKKQAQSNVSELKKRLQHESIRYQKITEDDEGSFVINLRDHDYLEKAMHLITKEYPLLVVRKSDELNQLTIINESKEYEKTVDYAIAQTITSLNNRINELGVSEAIVQREGLTKISVDLPGIQDIARAKDLIGKTATIRFHIVGHSNKQTTHTKDEYGSDLEIEKQPVLTGDSITFATASVRDGFPIVQIRLGGGQENIFYEATRSNIGNRMAVIYSELKTVTNPETGIKEKKLEEKVISAPVIQDALRNEFQISGLKTHEEAQNLALLLRSGSLYAPVEIVEELTIGPSMGQENIDKGLSSLAIGGLLILIFMCIYYRLFGLVANLGLIFNLLLTITVLSVIGATLTLPGIAGIVLGIGMAVDANVLINERIREELRNGMTPLSSISAGYDKAFATIVDANVTTLIVALILFGLGSGTVKGFAITLTIGLMASMFTAIFFTRAIIGMFYTYGKHHKISIGI
ncbi:MAG TPA: protein translocase subunit SecD [Gammaproteobacteria bacterium]|nr:protein translocase subunit SecD [Gammaproteobacteria bacterium]